MPKKAVKNPFYYFMIDFRDEQKENGVTFANMTEVQQAADPVWRASHPSLRLKYENIAKQQKAKYNVPECKFTTLGVPFSEIENQERCAKEANERELKDIQNFIEQNTFNKKILNEDIYIIDVNAYCETNMGYVIGEVTILRFNVRDGIKDHLHEIINPPKIPIGYASDIKLGSQELGLNFPDCDAPKTDFMRLLANIIDYLKHGQSKSSQILPPLYVMPEKQGQVLDFILQLCQRAHEDESVFRVYKLDVLFFYLINSLKSHANEGLPKESLALAALRKDAFKYTPGLGCEHHEAGERATECTQARVKRLAYTVLDGCCPLAGVPAAPGAHVPHDTDIEAVLIFKEKKLEERRLPECRAPSSVNSRDTTYDSFEPSASINSTWASRPTKSLQPLRKPTIDTLNFQSRIQAPELSESNFPPLSLGSGRGSGRNLTKNMKSLDLNK